LKKSDYQLIGYIGTFLGVILLIGGGFTALYHEDYNILSFTVSNYRYSQYSAPLLLAGIIFLVIGVGFLWRASQELEASKNIQTVTPFTSSHHQ
jgi:hypothetical protein